MKLDTLNLRSMLGIRFRDATTERPVTDGLHVSVRRVDGWGGRQPAVRTVSGAYVAQQIPGLRAFERAGPSRGAVPPPVEVRVAVEHERGWYVPVRLKAKVPYDPDPAKGGLFPITEMREGSAEEKREPTCYLFSSVRRPVRPGQSVVYADLVTGNSGADLHPAAHAVLQINYDHKAHTTSNGPNGNGSNDEESSSSTWYGIADEQGRVAVHFPTPPIQLEALRDGPQNRGRGNRNTSSTDGDRPLSTRTWPLTVRVHYNPSGFGSDPPDHPYLSTILGQKQGTLYSDAATTTSDLSATLAYGEPLVLHTDGLPDRTALRIDPHSS